MSLADKTIRSSMWIMLTRLIHRSFGIVSFLILARLLTPEDFGVVAITTMLVFLCDALSQVGSQQYIIQKQNITDNDLNTAWSIGIVMKTMIAIILVIFSGFAATYFENDKLKEALVVLSLILPLSALTSPRFVLLKKNFNYRPIVKVSVYERIASFIVSIMLAFILQNFWAMILGVVISNIVRVIMSYIVAPSIPKFTLVQVTTQWRFSQWMLLKTIIGYIKSEFDTVFVSKIFTLEALGGFTMMRNLSSTPAREIITPLTEPLLASFAVVKSEQNELASKVLSSIAILLSITAPIFSLLFYHDTLLISFLLDEKWHEYAPLLGLLAFFIIDYSINSVLTQALISIERVKVNFYFDLFSFAIIVIFFMTLFDGALLDFVLTRIYLAILSLLAIVIISAYFIKFNPLRLIILLLPIVLANGVSIYLANFAIGIFASVFFQLLFVGLLFIIFYILGLILFNKLFVLLKFNIEHNRAVNAIVSRYFGILMVSIRRSLSRQG